MLLVVEEPVHPVGRVQVNVYGAVSPAATALQVNAFPFVRPLVGQVTLLLSALPPTFAVTEPVAVTVLESRAVLLIEYVPFGEHVTEIVLVVDVPVHPVGRVHV